MGTIADVFIIETLDPNDEGKGRLEGVFLSALLRLHNKEPKYHYVRTKEQFKDAVRAFRKSNYRYLHLSCHGDQEGLCTTNQDEISFHELGEVLKSAMKGRRLFVSACKMVHKSLAKAVIPVSGCSSVIGPTKNIKFSDSAVVWAAIYHLAFSEDSQRMTNNSLRPKLKDACRLFNVSFAFFAKDKKSPKGYARYNIVK